MKIKIDNYSFDKDTGEVTFTDYSVIRLDGILLITNVTDNIIIYNFADPLKGGTVATNVLALEFDTTGMDNNDDLLIYYDDVTVVEVYNFVQKEETGSYKYYGYAMKGGWKIKRKVLATGVWGVAYDYGDYATAWADRANKIYNLV